MTAVSIWVLFLVLLTGAIAGAVAVWPIARGRGRGPAVVGEWQPDTSLVEGHRPPDLGALASQLLGLVRQVLQGQGVALLRRSETGWRVVATSPGAPFISGSVVPFKEGLVGLVGEGDREIAADKVHAEALRYLALGPVQLSVAMVPFHYRGENLGVLACHRPAGQPFLEPEVALLKRAASLTAGWEASAARVRLMESSRLQEARVAEGIRRMFQENAPDQIGGHLLDALFDVLPAYFGFVVLSSSTLQYYCIVTKRFQPPERFQLARDTWTYYVLQNDTGTLYLDGTTGRESAMPILFGEEPFPGDRLVLLHPLRVGGDRFGVVGIVGRGESPFSQTDRTHAEALLAPASAVLDLALLHVTQRNLAIRDALTGLFNRRYLDETLAVELKRAQRQGTHCGFILLDLDRFKAVNDSYGHDAGDTVLRGVANRIRESVRDIDVVCRYGGEEIAVILPDCDAGETFRVAERVRRCVAEGSVPVTRDLAVPATVSLGVSAFPAPSPSLSHLLKSVDAALYEAKGRGRNRTVLAGR